MVDSGCKVDFGGFERVVGWEVDSQEEETALEWAVTLCDRDVSVAFDRCRCMEESNAKSPHQRQKLQVSLRE